MTQQKILLYQAIVVRDVLKQFIIFLFLGVVSLPVQEVLHRLLALLVVNGARVSAHLAREGLEIGGHVC